MKLRVLISTLLLTFSLTTNLIFSQEGEEKPVSIEEIKGKVEGMDENVTTLLGDVEGLKKMKITGYFQIQGEKTESSAGFGANPYDANDAKIQGRVRIRRGRIKFTYDGGLTQYVFQGDFTNQGYELKDFYLAITDPWTKYVTLTAGVFNRPNYEVEYSSSQRESMERSKVIATLYPKERDLGFMFTVIPDDLFKLQIAAFNNTYNSDLSQFWPNYNSAPLYYMARITKEIAIPDAGIGIDLGVHTRMGNLIANTNKVTESAKPTSFVDSTSMKKGDAIGRNWFGFEAQIYWDLLGGMKLLGEYIMGSNADEPTGTVIRKRDFSGFYAMLVKNISEEWQVAVKYDNYNPNTKIAASDIDNTKDLAISTLGLGIHNYTFKNIRISLWYDMPKTTTSNNLIKGKALLPSDPKDNLLTLRFQYKF